MFICDISDHFPIYCIINKSINNSRKDTFISKRVFNDDGLLKIAHILQNTNWDFYNKNANECYNYFIDIFLDAYDSCFPVKQIKIKHKCNNAPWFNVEIKKLMKKKRNLLHC